MNLSVRLLLRVLYPRVGWPQGVTGFLPPEVLPSPPPCGWSTGFIATPRTFGRKPFQRDRPALPSETFSCSMLPTWPTVALQTKGTRRTSPEGMRKGACRARHLTAFSGTQFDIVNLRAQRDVDQRQRVAGKDVSLGPAHDRLTDFQTCRRDDVPLLAIEVGNQGDVS